jgi:uncharacterized protein
MLIYNNSTIEFLCDVRLNIISDKIREKYIYKVGREPSYSEYNSWQNSLSKLGDLIEYAELRNNMIILEYEVPYNTSRIDCLLFGKGEDNRLNIVLIELKQWSNVDSLEDDGNFKVETFTGLAKRVVSHPSQQVKGYYNYLLSFIAEFENKPELTLFGYSYCHNYNKVEGKGLFSPVYSELINEYPVYTKHDIISFVEKLKELLQNGDGVEIFNRFMQSRIKPSKKLLENVSNIIGEKPVFSLLNEQIVAKNLIWSRVNKSIKANQKNVIIVQGGPGTGKSVIALNVLAEAAKKKYSVLHGCKSKPFREGLTNLIGRDDSSLFTSLYSFNPNKVSENQLDLLLIDEAHRIEKNGNYQFMNAKDRTDMPQIDQLIRCAKTSVFFIDDKQNVRFQEIGNSDLIRASAKKFGIISEEVKLESQFRCMGSNDYLLWLDSVLGYNNDIRLLKKDDKFEFKIFESPNELYAELSKKEKEKRNSSRLTAGFCWSWSKRLDENGNLVKDVKIGDFEMPWETHGEISRPPIGYVKWYEWAFKPDGFKQIGCIYTAQGFEFEYVGVIIGDDLLFDTKTGKLITNITATKDPTLKRSKATFDSHVRNIYRTLLSRGMKACYVYFVNKETENYFKNRIEGE